MLKRLVNEARFALTITTTGPLLIKSGYTTLTGPDMTPVLTYRNGAAQVYIPGSSLKGVVRSHLEKVIRTLRPNEVVVADPFKSDPRAADQSCSAWLQQRKRANDDRGNITSNDRDDITAEVAYTDSDPIARMFGSTFFIGRVSLGDAYLADAQTGAYLTNLDSREQRMPTEQRDGVGIDRLTGGAAHGAKFELEVVSAGTTFRSDVVLRNFECWQLGGLLLVVQDMEDELLRLGSGRSRGLGAVRGTVTRVDIHHVDAKDTRSAGDIRGLGWFLGANSPYGTYADDRLNLSPAPAIERRGIRQVQAWEGAALANLKQQAVREFVRRIEQFPAYKQPRRRAG